MPSVEVSCFSSLRISSRSLASRLLRGSSSRSAFGSFTSARASASRCCWPPLNCGAGRFSKPSRWTRASERITRSRVSALENFCGPCFSGNATLSKTFMCGQMAYDWKTMPIGRLCGGVHMPRLDDTSTASSSVMSPSSGRSSPAMQRSVVDLPQPDGPSSVKNAPDSTSNVTSSTARTSP